MILSLLLALPSLGLLTAAAGAAAAAPAEPAAAAAPPPPSPYSGPKPPWPYRGFERFPAVWFGQNRSGLDNATQMDLEAKHQIVGWGWQQVRSAAHMRARPSARRALLVHIRLRVVADPDVPVVPVRV